MKILNNYTKKVELMAMLIELSQDYHELANESKYPEFKKYINLEFDVVKILEELEKN